MSLTFARVGTFVAAMVMATTSLALAETSATPAPKMTVAQAAGAPNFGSPPSGQIPILYNDHHVYAKPDTLKQGRVLAALVKGGTIFVPLRSMFEQTGATVSYDAASKTAIVSKPGAEVRVTVGKPEVVINGESRPLDVPPMIYQGTVLVPVRVISEGMGAYVQWVPDQHVVVVRYLPPTPPPPAPPPPAPVPTPAPTVAPPTPNPLTVSGFFRSYYFTRENASNNPGAQFNYSETKYSSTGVNQASWNNAIGLHADYVFPDWGGWYVGGSYFYAQPFSGPCSMAATHAKGDPCISQSPPNTNPDDTLPGFSLSTFPETYVGFKNDNSPIRGIAGDFLMSASQSPWAWDYNGTRLKPFAYQGIDAAWTLMPGLTLEAANIFNIQNRTSNTFTHNTLLTSYPAGGGGLASNIFVPGCSGATCTGINTPGFFYGKLGYAPKNSDYSVNGYLYGVADIVTMYWGDGRYTWNESPLKPFIALQGGWESNAGNSVIGKIQSSLAGVQVGLNVTKNVQIWGAYDDVPWRNDSVPTAYLTSINWKCSNSNFQLTPTGKAATATLPYFLPINAGQCYSNAANGTTSIYYGGWASPYTDNYATDPIFTSSIDQGMTDRRAPGTSEKVEAIYTSDNRRWVFLASDAWYNYGNALVGQNTNDWNLDGQYHFSEVPKTGHYKGLLLRYRYMQRSLSNTFCGDAGTSCPPGSTIGATYLGGLPLFKYNRAQLEYDF